MLVAIDLQKPDRVPMDFSANKATLERLLKDYDCPDFFSLIKTLGQTLLICEGLSILFTKGPCLRKGHLQMVSGCRTGL
jgi:hypothetical protein